MYNMTFLIGILCEFGHLDPEHQVVSSSFSLTFNGSIFILTIYYHFFTATPLGYPPRVLETLEYLVQNIAIVIIYYT